MRTGRISFRNIVAASLLGICLLSITVAIALHLKGPGPLTKHRAKLSGIRNVLRNEYARGDQYPIRFEGIYRKLDDSTRVAMGEMDGWYIGGLPIDEEDIARAPMLFYRTSDVDHGGGLIIYTSTRVEYYNEDIFQSILDNARREHGQALVRIDVRE